MANKSLVNSGVNKYQRALTRAGLLQSLSKALFTIHTVDSNNYSCPWTAYKQGRELFMELSSSN